MRRLSLHAALAAGALALSGCISLGSEPPDSLITLSSTAESRTGAETSDATGVIRVMTPEVPAKLDVLRVPVQIDDTNIAYLQDAVWVEKPARQFRHLLGEALRSRTSSMMVLDTGDTPATATETLRGTLLEMGYDATGGEVIVRFEALHTAPEGAVTSRRFEARESGIAPEAGDVGPALNRAANRVASDVADWLFEGG